MHPNNKNVLIPKTVHSLIRKNFISKYRETQPANLMTDEDILAKLVKSYLEVDIYIEGKAPGTLTGNVIFESARGGGRVDIQPLIKAKKGSFYMAFQVDDFEAKKSNLDDYDLFFWSTSQPLNVQGKRFGLACGTLVKLSPQKFLRKNGKGFQLNATADRYQPVATGTYYFARYQDHRLVMAVVQIGDENNNSECLNAPVASL